METMETPDQKTHLVCLGLGSNLGDRLDALKKAKQALEAYIDITAVSNVYETECFYISQQPLFLNAVLIGRTNLDAMGLLYTVRDLEFELGRKPTFHFGPRIIDIDILFFDDEIHQSPVLTTPHVGMHERLFVLKPLSEIAPDWRHPILKKTTLELLNELPKDFKASKIGPL